MPTAFEYPATTPARACSLWWAWLPVVLIAVLCAVWVLPHVGVMPDGDYWENMNPLLAHGSYHLTWHELFTRDNEHLVVIPKLMLVANAVLTGGDNRALAWVVVACALLCGLLLAVWLARTAMPAAICAHRWYALALGCAAAIATFTPMAAHNLFFAGMGGINWVSGNLAAIAAIYLVYRHPRSWGALALAVVCALLAALSFSTGIVVLAVLGLQLGVQRGLRRRACVMLFAGAVLVAVIYLTLLHTSGRGFERLIPGRDALFVLAFLGAAFATSFTTAVVLGGVGLALFAWFVLTALWRGRGLDPARAGWMALGVYVVLAAGMGAYGRVMFGGVAEALAGRYGSVPPLFWVALLGLALVASRGRRPSTWTVQLIVILAMTAGGCVAAVASGLPRVAAFSVQSTVKPVAALALYLGAQDLPAEQWGMGLWLGVRMAPRAQLVVARHVPFNGYFNRCPRLGTTIRIESSTQHGAPVGYVDAAGFLPGRQFVKVRGWVAYGHGSTHVARWRRPRCVAIANREGVVKGLGVAGLPRPDVAAALKRADAGFGWVGYARTGAHARHLAVYARSHGDGRWYPLQHVVDVSAEAASVQ